MARYLLPLVLLSLVATPAGAVTQIEVFVDGAFRPLDKSVVGTANPQIRILRDVDVPSNFSVLLARDDFRAGIGGAGRPISVGLGMELDEVATDVFEGVIDVPVGVNTLRIQPAGGGGDLLTATMLNYSNDYEDQNGNGLLDVDEDVNGNGLLDPSEDLNGNLYLDGSEDVDGDATLDLNLDGDPFSLAAGGLLDSATLSTPEGDLQHATSVILEFDPSASDADIGAFLRGSLGSQPFALRPVGVVVEETAPTRPRIVTVEILDATAPHVVARTLNGQSVLDPTLPPPTPPSFPLRYAYPNFADDFGVVLGENLPARLRNGAAPNAGQGYEAGATANRGGFDNGGTQCQVDNDSDGTTNEDAIDGIDNDLDGNFDEDPAENAPCDELDISWQHFFTQTFAAHRLLANLPSPGTARDLAIIDSGFGNGTAALPDVPAGRFVRPRNEARVPAGPAGVPPAIVPGNPASIAGIADNLIQLGSGAFFTHGTKVASLAAGNGTSMVLGTGNRVPVRPVRIGGRTPIAFIASQLAAYNTIGADRNVSVVNLSLKFRMPAASAAAGAARVQARRVALRAGINAMTGRNQVIVVCAGNESEPTARAYPAVFAVPNLAGTAIDDDNDTMTDEDGLDGVDNDTDGVVDEDPPENPLAIGVSATGVANQPRGPERFAGTFSNFGQRISISAPGQNVMGVTPVFTTPPAYQLGPLINGCSFATPQVAGAIAELINTARALPAGLFSGGTVTVAQGRQRVTEIVLATADDLGTSVATGGGNNAVSDNAGDGPDQSFGIGGRLNMWKAALSVVNQGLSAQHGRDLNSDGQDDRFVQLPVVTDTGPADTSTLWYGFEIVTSERQATVWIDGTQLSDGTAAMPGAPGLSAYKGVRSDLRVERGVHDLTDGSAQDPVIPGPPVMKGLVVEEDPTSGIVAVGTRAANRGQYVLTFSIQRADLYDGNTPRTLSIRKRGAGVGSKPLFNLRLDTAKMRNGQVSGVSFDDFVFQIVPPDYGDAAIPPTLMAAESGARHENTNLEWFGRLDATNPQSVTPEHNADPEASGGDPGVDVDGVDNRQEFHDRDGRDDGFVFFPLSYQDGEMGKVQFSVGVFDAMSARYAGTADRSLYVNLWMDWDNDGEWEEDNDEHVIDGLQIDPSGPWSIVSQGASGSTAVKKATATDGNAARFEVDFQVGSLGCSTPIWARARVDYGENAGRNDPRPAAGGGTMGFRSLPSLRNPALADGTAQPAGVGLGFVNGAARYGEVEDYAVGVDFGDAPDPFTASGKYPTLESNQGPRHLDFNKEWLGPDDAGFPSVSWETDADLEACDDEDGSPNLPDQDGFDDALAEVPQFVAGEAATLEIRVSSSVSARGSSLPPACDPTDTVSDPEDAADSLPRYCATDPQRRLYLAGWADWNANGEFEAGEKIVDVPVDPVSFGADGAYTLGEAFTDANQNGVRDANEAFADSFGKDGKVLSFEVTPPEEIAPIFHCRFRLGFGEDEALVDHPLKEADEEGRNNAQEKGGALFGEVEDVLCSSTQPDQLHLQGPGEVESGSNASVTASLSLDFAGLEDAPITFTRAGGDFSFQSGAVSTDGTQSIVVTDGDGLAQVQIQGGAQGPAVIAATVTGTSLIAFAVIQVVPPPISCGLGFELALPMALLYAWHARRRRAFGRASASRARTG